MGKTIYFIHGAYSANRVWGDMQRVISEDRDMRDFSIKFTSHTTSEENKGFFGKLFGGGKGADVNSVAKDILSSINQLVASGEDIYIATHSLGGVSLRKALLQMDNDSLNKIVKIIYFDTPSTSKGFNSICNIYGNMEAQEFGVDENIVEEACQKIAEFNPPYKEMMIYAAYGRKIDESAIPKCIKKYEIHSLRHPDCCKIDGNKHLGYDAMKRFFLGLDDEAIIEEELPQTSNENLQNKDGIK